MKVKLNHKLKRISYPGVTLKNGLNVLTDAEAARLIAHPSYDEMIANKVLELEKIEEQKVEDAPKKRRTTRRRKTEDTEES